MTEPDHDPHSIDAWLDGQMAEEERRHVARAREGDVAWQRQLELQRSVDDVLRRQFRVPEVADAVMAGARQQAHAEKTRTPRPPARTWSTAAIALLATAAVLILAINGRRFGGGPRHPYFRPTPLIELYANAVANGFRPYYECRDADRFAGTLERRQGVPLRLAQFPVGSRMLGLSYPGGLSRDTTAMLCEVEGQPVMVFVDRQQYELAELNPDRDAPPYLFRRHLADLVLYEITPFRESRVLSLLEIDDADP